MQLFVQFTMNKTLTTDYASTIFALLCDNILKKRKLCYHFYVVLHYTTTCSWCILCFQNNKIKNSVANWKMQSAVSPVYMQSKQSSGRASEGATAIHAQHTLMGLNLVRWGAGTLQDRLSWLWFLNYTNEKQSFVSHNALGGMQWYGMCYSFEMYNRTWYLHI